MDSDVISKKLVFSEPLWLGMRSESMMVRDKMGEDAWEILRMDGLRRRDPGDLEDDELLEPKFMFTSFGGKAFPSETAARLWAEVSGNEVVFLSDEERDSDWLLCKKIHEWLGKRDREILRTVCLESLRNCGSVL